MFRRCTHNPWMDATLLMRNRLTIQEGEEDEPGAGAGHSPTALEDDFENEADLIAKEGDEDEKEKGQGKEDYRAKFIGAKDKMDKQAVELKEKDEELARLRTQTEPRPTTPATGHGLEPNEQAMVDRAVTAAEQEYFGLPKEKQTPGTFTRIHDYHVGAVHKQLAVGVTDRRLTLDEQKQQGIREGEVMAAEAFKEVGLDFADQAVKKIFWAEVADQQKVDDRWFNTTSSADQYPVLAERSLETIKTLRGSGTSEDVSKAKEELRKEAGSQVSTGSGGRTPPSSKKKGAEESDEGGTMVDAMNQDRLNARKRGSASYKLAGNAGR